jgi:DNA-binding transcriptional regulator YiaG
MVRYEGLGLDNVWLVNGYERIETGYGPALVVDHVEDLERAVASSLAEQRKPLNGAEFRFLREMLEMSQGAFGTKFGRDYQTVARWEAARDKSVPQAADAMIRQLYLEKLGQRPLFTMVVDERVAAAREGAGAVSWRFREAADGSWMAEGQVLEPA